MSRTIKDVREKYRPLPDWRWRCTCEMCTNWMREYIRTEWREQEIIEALEDNSDINNWGECE